MSLVTLRPFAAGDADWLDTWIATVAVSVGYDLIDADAPGTSLLGRLEDEAALAVQVIERDGDRVGLIVCRIGTPRERAAIIELVATPPALARRGSGMSAAVSIEDDLRAVGVRDVYAPAAAMHGIAIYFWIRLGYRPLPRSEWPCDRPGVAWLVRSI